MRRLTNIVVCVAVVLAASSCSSDSGSEAKDPASGRTTTEVDSSTTTTTEATTTTEDRLAKLPEPDSYEAAIAAVTGTETSTVPLSAEQATCVAPKWVEVAGVERLEDNGITPLILQQDLEASFAKLGLSEEDGNALADALGGCGVDLKALYLQSASVRSLEAETKACLEQEVTEDFVRRLLIVTLTKGGDALAADPALTDQLTAVLKVCPGLLGAG